MQGKTLGIQVSSSSALSIADKADKKVARVGRAGHVDCAVNNESLDRFLNKLFFADNLLTGELRFYPGYLLPVFAAQPCLTHLPMQL